MSAFLLSNSSDNYLELYGKKIHKEISKIFKGEVSIEEIEQTGISNLGENNSIYNLQSDNKNIGFININKVNACLVGGCSRPNSLNTTRYDHFYYMAVFDINLSILKITVLDYQSEYGYEICSKSWLKQFKGSPDKYFEYDKNIDAISGATVSAEALVDELNSLKKRIQKIFHIFE